MITDVRYIMAICLFSILMPNLWAEGGKTIKRPANMAADKQMSGKVAKEIPAVSTNRQLFIDEKFIENKKGIALVLNPPVKSEPLSLSVPPYGFISVVEHAERYYMYYRAHKKDGGSGYAVAVSSDGIKWENPDVGIPCSIVVPDCDQGGVFIDPKASDGCPFKGIFGIVENTAQWGSNLAPCVDPIKLPNVPLKQEGALYLFRSRDGFAWECVPSVAVPFVCDTANQVFYDSRLDKYAAYLRGFQDQAGLPYHGKGRIVARAEMSDLMQMPWPFRKNEKRPTGPRGCYGYIHDEMDIVMASDGLDPQWADVYNPGVNLYPYAQDVYLAFPSIFRTYGYGGREWREKKYGPPDKRRDIRGETAGDGLTEIHLAVSRDGTHFTRFHAPYLKPGMIFDRYGVKGEADSGWIGMGIGMVRQGDYLYQYYGASGRTHISYDDAKKRGLAENTDVICRTTQRLDGFVSADAGPEGGEIVTPALIFSGNRLVLNADCGGLGEIWVELQDKDGKPIPGYSLAEAVSIDRNGTAQEIWWKNGPDVSKLAGQPVRLHIKMRSAKLYAFQFVLAEPSH